LPILTQVFGSLVALVAPLAIAGARIASRINQGLGVVESAVAAAETAEQKAKTRLEGQKQAILAELSQLDTQQALLQKEIRHAQVRVKAAASAVDNASTGRLLAGFLSERSASTDYRSQLGMIAMIRRDFEQLVGLLDLEPEGDDAVPHIERIVLYIDDLDRCAPDRVVEVLQAIHLLLGLELFVVVVAVDARWLLSSLELHFEKVLGARPQSPGDRGHWSATPMNYLEKIFQIPFNLSAMDSDSYAQLVGSLLESDDSAEALRHLDSEDPSGIGISPRVATQTGTATPAAPVDTAGLKRLNPAGLLLTDEEKEFAQRLGPLIGTPRAAKRLTNLYRLIQASLPDEALSGMLDSGGYEAILLLLAILVGHPSDAPALFGKAQGADDETVWSEFAEGLPGLAEVQPHVRQLKRASAVKPWIPVVARYSFQVGP
jgi:hypothetical protein